MSNTAAIDRFVGSINGAAKGIGTNNRVALEVVAQFAKTTMLNAPGAPKFLSGVGARGAKVGVGYSIVGLTNATARVRWRGPAHLVNNPTAAHYIVPRRRKALRFRNGDFAMVAEHPGTRGKHFFEASREVIKRGAPEIFHRQVRGELVKHFRG